MPAAPTQILCTDCDFRHVIDHRPISIVYNFPDGQKWTTGRKFGWCYECNGISDIEPDIRVEDVMPKLEELKATMKTLKYKLKAALAPVYREKLLEPEQLRDLQHQLLLAASRKSLPRCLHCGKEGAVPLWDEKAGQFEHECGGQFYSAPLDKKGGDEPVFEREYINLDMEGMRINKPKA